MDYGKYIIVEVMGADTPILFPSFINHCDIARGFGGKKNVISAGFFEVGAKPTKKDPENIEVSVFGKSETLNKKVNKETDPCFIQKLLRRQEVIW